MIKKLSWAKHQKRWFGKWHLYLGIFAGLVVAFIGVTGSILVFAAEIDAALNPELFQVKATQRRLSLPQVTSAVHQYYPHLQYHYVTIPAADKPFDTYILLNKKTMEQVFINPYTGKICGRRLNESAFIGVVTKLHTTLFIPGIGRYVTGISTLILLILTISGLRLWIPAKWNKLKEMLTVKFSASLKRKNYDWHNVIGFYSSPVILVLSLTGVLISFSFIFVPLIFLLNGKSAKGVASLLNAQSVVQQSAKPLNLGKVLEIAHAEMPGAEVLGLNLPAGEKGSYRLDLIAKGRPATGRRKMLSLDQYSGKVLLNSDRHFPEVGLAYLSWLGPVHYGSFGGLPTKVLALLAGLVPLVLCITGFVIWVPRWRKQRRYRKAEGAAKSVPADERCSNWSYLRLHLKKGLVYGFWMWLSGCAAGAVYGLVSGLVLQPALFVVLFTALLVLVNFMVAFPLMAFNTILLMPFSRDARSITRYFGWSLGIFFIFTGMYLLIDLSGIHLF